MGDISAEPSMEEILSSIKRIIAEEGDAPAGRRRPAARPAAPPVDREHAADEEVLELIDPIPPAVAFVAPQAAPEPVPVALARAGSSVSEPVLPEPVAMVPPVSQSEPILSPVAADATRGALDSLSRLMIKPETNGDGTLEGLVRDMLRPMLREWLDAHLPDMVENMVAREIARISGQTR
jgi:hypothetical protein